MDETNSGFPFGGTNIANALLDDNFNVDRTIFVRLDSQQQQQQLRQSDFVNDPISSYVSSKKKRYRGRRSAITIDPNSGFYLGPRFERFKNFMRGKTLVLYNPFVNLNNVPTVNQVANQAGNIVTNIIRKKLTKLFFFGRKAFRFGMQSIM